MILRYEVSLSKLASGILYYEQTQGCKNDSGYHTYTSFKAIKIIDGSNTVGL